MGKPYADDLKLGVVRLVEEGSTRPEVVALCGVSLSSIPRHRQRQCGQVCCYKDYALARLGGLIKRQCSAFCAISG